MRRPIRASGSRSWCRSVPAATPTGRPASSPTSSAGTASTSYLAGEVFKQVAKIDIVHLPHKGAPEAMTSILRNDSQLYFVSANLSTELIEGKKIKILAVSSDKRFPPLPGVPTVR